MTIPTTLRKLALPLALFFLVACSGSNEPNNPNLEQLNQLSISNFAEQYAALFTGGEPTQKQLGELADLGIKHVINLQPITEQKEAHKWNEAELVQSLSMQYHAIPIYGAQAITIENATRLAALLDTLKGEPTFLHCASSNRVGALKALYEGAINKLDTEEAVAIGKQWGLSSLEPVVRKQLAAPQ